MNKEFKLVAELKTFDTDSGDKRDYISLSVDIAGQKFVLQPRQDDKKLFNYLVKPLLKA